MAESRLTHRTCRLPPATCTHCLAGSCPGAWAGSHAQDIHGRNEVVVAALGRYRH
ncbi:hypothetical protein CKAH01_00455 [Colletotrichum kahawae]|uniref:Uncharacterized protein n=1 Tax=Colletotrichum kahawae TaxID=34407 RepID=A0AAD9YVY9_COLKA|nr:hypothetical protein CKAH01_00455 [Colletotrichum kahawae]